MALPKKMQIHVKRVCHLPGSPCRAPNHTLGDRYQSVTSETVERTEESRPAARGGERCGNQMLSC